MPTLRRNDGSQFVIQSYRELLTPDRTSVLKRKIRSLSQNYGTNVRLFKHEESGAIEAVFSREPGFLLGETLWLYLEKPVNLIYCEALPERRQGLLIVVRNNVVFIDANMSFTNLVDEFLSLSATDEKFEIYTWGDIPLAQRATGGKFAFAEKNVISFTELEHPLFEKLPITTDAQLQPLELALTSPYLGKPKIIPLLVASGFVALVIISWHMLHEASTVAPPQFIMPKPVVSPYLGFYKELATPSPKDKITQFVATTDLVETIPGWEVTQINYTGNKYVCRMTTKEGSLTQIQKWANTNNYGFVVDNQGVSLTIETKLKNREKPKNIYSANNVLTTLLDDLNIIVPRKEIHFSPPTSKGPYKEAYVTINLSEFSIGKLLIIGEELDKLPVTITSINMMISTENTFSGKIKIKVLGD